jgi:hypothetical protein
MITDGSEGKEETLGARRNLDASLGAEEKKQPSVAQSPVKPDPKRPRKYMAPQQEAGSMEEVHQDQ